MTAPCDTCGACCRNLAPAGPPIGRARIEPALHDGMNMRLTADGTCVALVDGRCSIYESRPEVCRTFAVGGVLCNRARAVEHLAPLPLEQLRVGSGTDG